MKESFRQSIQRRLTRHLNNALIALMALRVARSAPKPGELRPVAFFKASSGIDDLSWNSAFHLLTSWGLRLQGIPVVYFACRHGMTRCVLGSDRDNPSKEPPCRSCIYQSRTLYTGALVSWFGFERSPELAAELEKLSLDSLMTFEYRDLPLGPLALPGLRWILRRHHLNDDEATRFFLREYILSAWNVAVNFERFLDQVRPQSVVVFNGQFYPEATAKWVAKRRGLRVISHEVGLQPASGFFTDGEATIYPIHIPADFEMSEAQNDRLDAYLQKRFQGNFSMAGVKFWPSIKGLDEAFDRKAAQFKQIVAVFTNVIFDTSQPHANTLFEDMFVWLDLLLESAGRHPETLFVIRAHPDEMRVRKAGLETVAGWVAERRASELPNILFVPPDEHLSSYELIARSKFVMIYNSTIGLEAAIMGAAVLCAGKARFTQYPTVFFPPGEAEYASMLESFLAAEPIEVPAEFCRNARRFLYYQLFRSSLPFGKFLETGVRSTHARLKWFDPRDLRQSAAIQTVSKGLFENTDFLLDENQSLEW
jgi:hypothetical protein